MAAADEPRIEALRLAAELASVDARLKHDIDEWLVGGGSTRSPVAAAVAAGARSQQAIYRTLVSDPALAASVARELEPPLAAAVEANVAAGARLRSLVAAVETHAVLATAEPAEPGDLRRFYDEGEREHGVPWELLASVNFVESRFGRVVGPSPAGACGPMQFMPATWEHWGGGGDVMDPRASILAAARFLAGSGAPGEPRRALFTYNRSEAYVEAILGYAGEMRRDDREFYAYYFWEPYVRTRAGDVRLAAGDT